MDLLDMVDKVNNKMPKNRTIEIIALKAGEELGELNEAILTKIGQKAKLYEDMEGVAGEAIDLALCALSIALKEASINEVTEIINNKINKWKNQFENKQ